MVILILNLPLVGNNKYFNCCLWALCLCIIWIITEYLEILFKCNWTSFPACLLDTSCAKIGYEGKYVTFKAIYPPDYETNTKYFGKTDGFYFFEKLVQASYPNRWAKQGRFALFDNTSTHVLTAVILGLVAEDSGNYSFGVDIKLLPDVIGDEIQLTVVRGENPLTSFYRL